MGQVLKCHVGDFQGHKRDRTRVESRYFAKGLSMSCSEQHINFTKNLSIDFSIFIPTRLHSDRIILFSKAYAPS